MKTCKIAKPQIIDHSTDIKSGASWFKPTSLADFFQVVKQLQGKQTKFVAGNTISGLYKDKHTVDAFVHLSAIEGLVDIKVCVHFQSKGPSKMHKGVSPILIAQM